MNRYDSVVIGSGPGGEGAAMKLAKSGHRVALCERHSEVGGGCTHWGTIPSKTLRHAVEEFATLRSHPLYRRALGPIAPNFPDLLARASQVIGQQTAMRERFHHRNNVDIYTGHASLRGPNEIEVTDLDRNGRHIATLQADNIVISTGSHPYRPDDIDFTHPRVLDSDTVLTLNYSPRSITIYGAGVIGCEYASVFGTLGIKVNLINTRDRLLAFLDDEITDALGYHLRELGVITRHNEEYETIEGRDGDVVAHLKSGKRIRSEAFLWANGRTGNTAGMGLEALGIAVNHRGQIEVNENYQTSEPHIYAVGDVVGFPSLASASYDQGRFAATYIAEGACGHELVENIPTGIYSVPEISSLGPTERELTEAKVPYEVGRAFFKSVARAQIVGQPVGMLKLLFHADTRELLGIHCFGYQAAEIVHIGQAVMSQPAGHNTLDYFVETTFNYPTMAEAYRAAALNGLNRLVDPTGET